MRHVTLTCKNHPDLRWSCKAIAFTPGPNGGYNGARSIFFFGRYNPESILGGDLTYEGQPVNECSCPSSSLILAPEDPGTDLGPGDVNGWWV